MINIQRTIGILACGLAAVAASPSAFAEAESGFYLGLAAGQAKYDLSQNDLDDLVFSTFSDQGFPVLSGSSTLEDQDTAWSIVGGYRLNPYLALEATYVSLGTAEYRSSGLVNPPGPVTSLPVSLNLDFESSGFTTVGIGSIPVGDNFELHGRLGILFSESEVSISTTVGSGRSSQSLTSSAVDFVYGLGAAFHIDSYWSLGLDAVRYADVGDDDDTEETDIDVLSLSVIYRFL